MDKADLMSRLRLIEKIDKVFSGIDLTKLYFGKKIFGEFFIFKFGQSIIPKTADKKLSLNFEQTSFIR
jgi:hypothetical protein